MFEFSALFSRPLQGKSTNYFLNSKVISNRTSFNMKALGLTLLPRAAKCIGLIQCSLSFLSMISIYKINAN